MTRYDWNETARGLAGFVQKFRFLIERGVVPLQVENEREPEEANRILFGVFGRGDEDLDSEGHEAEMVRQQLQEERGLHELGFGLSGDGSTWAMLIGADPAQYQTRAGQTLHKELMKVFLENAVCRAALEETVNPQLT